MKILTIALVAAVQLTAANLVTAQTSPATSSPAFLPPGPPPFGQPSVAEVLAHMLSLTDAQKAQIQPYADVVQPQLDAIHQQAHRAANNLIEQLQAQIRPLLTPEQQSRMDARYTFGGSLPPPSGSPGLGSSSVAQ